MKKKLTSLLATCLLSVVASAQIGINNAAPKATFDIVAKDLSATAKNNEGILIPRLSKERVAQIDSSSLTSSTMIYVDNVENYTPVGEADAKVIDITGRGFYYYYDDIVVPANSRWKPMQGWSLVGNSDTDPTVNFIGTIDDQSLAFRVHNIKAGYISNKSDGNIGFGLNSNIQENGERNVAIGNEALKDSSFSGLDNVAIGYKASTKLSGGEKNIAIGTEALLFNAAGGENIAIGYQALANTFGGKNIALGTKALASNVSGISNIVLGNLADAIEKNPNQMIAPTGAIAIGAESKFSGDYSITIGNQANTKANSSIAIGRNASATAENAIAIGQGASATVANTLVIGTSTSSFRVGIGRTPNAKLDLRSNPTSPTDPGEGMIGVGTTSSSLLPLVAGAGAIRYSTGSGGILQYSNGATWNTLGSTPSKSVVVASKNTTQTFPSASVAANAITDWTEETDTNNNFTPSTGVFTAPRSGNYIVSFTTAFEGGSVDVATRIEAVLIINSGGVIRYKKTLLGFPTAGTSQIGTSLSFIIKLNANDTVTPGIWHDTGHVKTLRVDEGFNNFSVTEL